MSRASDLLQSINRSPRQVDALVVGAGPAGLSAGIYLSRYLRSVIVVDAGNQRASWIPTSRNFPGWPSGVHGNDLLQLLRTQASEFGALIESGSVSSLTGSDGNFVATLNGRQISARTVLIASGIKNLYPTVIDEAVRARATSLRTLRWCPICDPPEIGSKVAVIGSYTHGVKEAMFMRTYTSDITIVPVTTNDLTEDDRTLCDDFGIKYTDSGIKSAYSGTGTIILNYVDGTSDEFKCAYPSLGSKVNNELLIQMNCSLDDSGCAIVDDHCMTNVPGIYAAGDITVALDQLTVAMGQAAIASTDMHNRMRKVDTPAPSNRIEVSIKGGLTDH